MAMTSPSRSRACVVMMLCLCACVIVQMLGVPTTLLNAGDLSDPLGSAVLEGFSVPPPAPELPLATMGAPSWHASPILHVPVIASAVFHPPVR